VKLRVVHKDAKNLTYTPVMGTSGDSNLETSKTTDYVGNIIYENGGLKRVLVDGGYIENNKYHYYLKDHLGNNRAVVDQYNTLIQSTQYYPFGMAFADGYDNGTKQPYKYNGKELDQVHGLNLYDYAARHSDGAVPHFTSVDPHAEKYYSISPYAYCNNNPLKYIDPTGKAYEFPPFNPTYYQQAAASKKVDKTIKENSSTIQKNAMIELAAMSDANDATVLTTAVTRGGNAINLDGSPASGVDIAFAGLGAIIPAVSGSAIKSIFKSIGKALGLGGAAKAIVGLSGDAAEFVAKSKRADHAMIHLVDEGILQGTHNSSQVRNQWAEVVADVTMSPTKTFDYVLEGTKTKGFYKEVGGKNVVMFVAKENRGSVQAGQVIGSWVPTSERNPDIMKLIGQ